jgi:hypothetical protein
LEIPCHIVYHHFTLFGIERTLAMPVEERVGLEDEECFFSMLDATSEENETHDQLN